MRLPEYFGMKVCYSTLKMKEHVFHRLAEIFLERSSLREGSGGNLFFSGIVNC